MPYSTTESEDSSVSQETVAVVYVMPDVATLEMIGASTSGTPSVSPVASGVNAMLLDGSMAMMR